jgi:hypothetical protein
MTSVLNVDEIAAKNGTSPVTLTKQSAAKVWVNFNGTGTIAERNSTGLSSLTDNGTGDYTITATNAFDSANYSPVVGGSPAYGSFTSFSMQIANNNSGTEVAPTSTAIRITYGNTSSYHDVKYATCTINGDLA